MKKPLAIVVLLVPACATPPPLSAPGEFEVIEPLAVLSADPGGESIVLPPGRYVASLHSLSPYGLNIRLEGAALDHIAIEIDSFAAPLPIDGGEFVYAPGQNNQAYFLRGSYDQQIVDREVRTESRPCTVYRQSCTIVGSCTSQRNRGHRVYERAQSTELHRFSFVIQAPEHAVTLAQFAGPEVRMENETLVPIRQCR